MPRRRRARIKANARTVIVSSLMNHLRPYRGIDIFPRMLGVSIGDQILQKEIDRPDAYINAALTFKGDVFVSVYSIYEIANRAITTIFLDIDVKGSSDMTKNLSKAYQILQANLAMLESLGIDVGKLRIYFSGMKGFHLYIDFRPIYLPENVSFKSLILYLFNRLQLLRHHCSDPNVIGDLRRLSRVPYTRHLESNMYCVPIDPTEDLSDILEYAENPLADPRPIHFNPKAGNELRKHIVDILSRSRVFAEKIIVRKSERPKHIGHLPPPCIRAWLRELKETGELDHYARLNLAIYFLRKGRSIDYIDAIFRTYSKDYNPRKTRYQIEYAKKYRGRGLLMWSCPHLIDLDLCPLDNPRSCPYYPSINKAMGWS